MAAEFRWNAWNEDHATKHGCSIQEIESVVCRHLGQARHNGPEKRVLQGRGQGDRVIQVVFLYGTLFVIHAMPLSTRRRRGRR
jgi:uncharacterized DUF497 family protein